MDCKTAQEKIMPYIYRELSDREMEDFIEHIRECKTCSEELEVYFTIYYALETLEDEGSGSYDIRQHLERDLEAAQQSVRNHQIVRFYQKLFLTAMGFVIAVIILTGIQAFVRGSFRETTLYGLFGKETEAMVISETTINKQSEKKAEEMEPETNQKRQIIITIPETEPDTETPFMVF